MDASSRDNGTTAVYECVTDKNKNLLFADIEENTIQRVVIWDGKHYQIHRVASGSCRVFSLTRAEHLLLLVVFTYHSST
jgi:hypothetical protein